MPGRGLRGFLSIGLAAALFPAHAAAQYESGGLTLPGTVDLTPHITSTLVISYVITAGLGLVIGAAFSDRFAHIRRYAWRVVIGLLVIISLLAPYPLNGLLAVPIVLGIFIFTVVLGLAWGRFARGRSTTFGSAKWATADYLQERGLVGNRGIVLGDFNESVRAVPLHYEGDRHLLTVAPTRAGKGVSAIIPNLLVYNGSAFVIDPKGENAMITATRRKDGLGQKVHIVDPWGLTTGATGLKPACFNPLDWIDPESPEMGENAMILADSLVVPPQGGSKEPFWDEEAKGLLMGLILYVATAEEEAQQRHLGRVRDLLMLTVAGFDALMEKMLASPHSLVSSTAARTLSKDPKLLSNVLSAAQAHTHIFDSPKLRESLSRSDFRFEDLKREPTTIFLVLPADRLGTFGRWLRLLVQQALAVTARDIESKPAKPILFLLDEMPALGRLTMVEQAYGLMAGFGIQLWGIVQDLSQLHRVYDDGWQTFIGNSGVLQYFGSRDKMTAEYFSALCGVTTIRTITSTIAQSLGANGSGSTSQSAGEASRQLALADELMRIDSTRQLVLVENLDPIIASKLIWFQDDRFRTLGRNLHAGSIGSKT